MARAMARGFGGSIPTVGPPESLELLDRALIFPGILETKTLRACLRHLVPYMTY